MLHPTLYFRHSLSKANVLLLYSDATLLVRGCNQLGQFLSHRETNLRYLALESLCLLATSEFSHDSVKKHQETVINALKVDPLFRRKDFI